MVNQTLLTSVKMVRRCLVIVGFGIKLPRMACISIETRFVRDAEFYSEIAAEIGQWCPTLIAEIELKNEEIVRDRQYTQDRMTRSEIVLDTYQKMIASREKGWEEYRSMVAGRTFRQVVRNCKNKESWRIADELARFSERLMKSLPSDVVSFFIDIDGQ